MGGSAPGGLMALKVSRRAAARFVLAKQGLLEATIPAKTGTKTWTGAGAEAKSEDGLRLWRKELKGEDGVLAAIRRLECVQIDPVALVGERNHHLVLRNRVGGYLPEQLNKLLSSGRVFEHIANARCFLPVEDYPIFWWRMRRFAANQGPARGNLGDLPERIVAEIQEGGPRTARSIESDEKVVGYWDQSSSPRTKATSLALELLWESGELMIATRDGIEKVYDLPERIISDELRRDALEMGEEEARRLLLDKYFRAYRLFDVGDFRFGWQKIPAAKRRDLVNSRVENGELVAVEIDGVRRGYYVLPGDAPLLRDLDSEGVEVAPHVFILPPLDSLLWRRERLLDLFEFDYTWEIYMPPAKRRFGPYTMPILRGDRFVGRIDARFEREKGALVVEGLWLDQGESLDRPLEEAVFDLAEFVGAKETVLSKAVSPGHGYCRRGGAG